MALEKKVFVWLSCRSIEVVMMFRVRLARAMLRAKRLSRDTQRKNDIAASQTLPPLQSV
jgi:hypothetical protein